MKHFIITLTALLLFGAAFGQGKPAKPAKFADITIHTSANCGDCKQRLETAMGQVKGVKSSELNLDTKNIVVTYRPKKVDPTAIRKAITRVGYDADELVADQEAHDNLPMCCRKGGHE